MEERYADLKDHYLVVELSLSRLLSFCIPKISEEKLKSYKDAKDWYGNRTSKEEKALIQEVENIIRNIYDTLQITIGKNSYEIILKPFYDSYHRMWVREDFEAFIDDIEETQIYLVIVGPGSWNDFNLILQSLEQLYKDADYDYSKRVFYVDVPWTSIMHRWK